MDANKMTRGFFSADDLQVAGLPHAPLAMPKQQLERAPRGLLLRALLAVTPRATRTEG